MSKCKDCGNCQHFGLCGEKVKNLTEFGMFCGDFVYRPPYILSDKEAEMESKKK